ncbi:putative duf250 domain membrane protein [Phaeoacremonium minimum UCRPA7]|uniref:Putative duf250 domain membrane protein n=1 Tax=Phaeoacremonium minimum (strain UCR-PA7) TaxID=1286976 RepID=R8BEE0_PHAM7|nr:putative duf250 domain membrane protein [Phaeoacremonium minimum UCRPA7]EON97650.1 putative duf250 domain membrane protein [Phaeoacremonium minimum UCRPA7]
MLKAAAPVAVLICSWIWGVANPSVKTFLNVMIIVFGVGLASVGEIAFSWMGFIFQVGGIVFEAMRLVMIQVMLSEEGQGMDPLVSLYYYAPVCAVMNFIVAWLSEASKFEWEDLYQTGMGILLLNAAVAFMLNVSSVFLIGKTSGLVMTLTGILKNILLIVAGVMIWGTSITALQLFGYMIALGGLVYYSLGWEQIMTLSQGAGTWAKNMWESPSLDESRLSPLVKRTIMMVLAFFIGALLIGGFLYSGSDSVQVSARAS